LPDIRQSVEEPIHTDKEISMVGSAFGSVSGFAIGSFMLPFP
jgi:hypothetical protein